ncbi:MAG TPA: tetratricopeptide repeat protein [Longimicrobiaceae bacterium]|nr:tetratricopeptide repeat protein [Longimicrobiaceae bacterium]
MSPRRLKLDQALGVLPDADALAPLREALIGASREDAERAWTASEAYATLDTRLADPRALEAQVAALAEQVRERTEAVLRHALRALHAAEAGDPAEAARALVAAGEVEEGAGRLEEAKRFFYKALELGRKPRDRRTEGLALRRLGRVAVERGEFERAAELYRRGFEVAEAQRDLEGAVVACQGMGNAYVYQGMWERAREWYARGLELLEGKPPSRLLWQLQSNLSVVARRAGALEESAAWLERAEATSAALEDAEAHLPLANGWGKLHEARGELEAAERAYRDALAGVSTPTQRGSVLINLAECLLLQGRLRDAERVTRELERVAVTQRLTPLLPHVYRGLGAIARERGDEEGFVFYEQALELCREPDSPPIEQAVTQHEYGVFEARMERTDSALARLREAREVYRRLGAGPELARVEADLAEIEKTTEG